MLKLNIFFFLGGGGGLSLTQLRVFRACLQTRQLLSQIFALLWCGGWLHNKHKNGIPKKILAVALAGDAQYVI